MSDILTTEEFQKKVGLWTTNSAFDYTGLMAHDAALRAELVAMRDSRDWWRAERNRELAASRHVEAAGPIHNPEIFVAEYEDGSLVDDTGDGGWSAWFSRAEAQDAADNDTDNPSTVVRYVREVAAPPADTPTVTYFDGAKARRELDAMGDAAVIGRTPPSDTREPAEPAKEWRLVKIDPKWIGYSGAVDCEADADDWVERWPGTWRKQWRYAPAPGPWTDADAPGDDNA